MVKTLRDEIAIAAMQGDLASQTDEGQWGETNFHFLAERSYLIADAMLAARGDGDE